LQSPALENDVDLEEGGALFSCPKLSFNGYMQH